MKKVFIFFSCIVLTSVLWIACSKKNEQDISQNNGNNGNTGGTNTCDTANMAYQANVRPIMQASCTGCHSTGSASGGVVLDTYAGIKTVADNGRLIGSITHASGFSPMPRGSAKLSDCNINKVRAWINRGAQNN